MIPASRLCLATAFAAALASTASAASRPPRSLSTTAASAASAPPAPPTRLRNTNGRFLRRNASGSPDPALVVVSTAPSMEWSSSRSVASASSERSASSIIR